MIFGRYVHTAESVLSAWIRSPTGSSEDGEMGIHTSNAVIVVGSSRSRRVACIWSADVAPISVTVVVRDPARAIPSLVARDIPFADAFMRSAPLPGELSGICRVWHMFRLCIGWNRAETIDYIEVHSLVRRFTSSPFASS